MSVLTATAIITAVDRASPVFSRLAASAQNAARVYGGVAQQIQRVGQSAAVNFAFPAAVGFAALIHRTQEFEKALVGVQIAQITDNIGAGGVINFTRIRSDAERIRQEALRISEALALPPAGILRAGEAAAKMGLTADSLSALMAMGGAVNIQDQSVTPSQAAEFLGSMGILFRAGQTGDDYNADYTGDITRLANQMLYVANATRTSAGRMQEGLRIFAPLFASFGEDFPTTTALIGAAVQAGQLDIEMGTALRSLGTRMLNPTRQGREAMLLAGIDRSQFMDLQAVSAQQALTRLKGLTNVQVGRGAWTNIQAILSEGQTNRSFADPAYQQRLLQAYNQATGATTQDAQDANAERVMMSLLTGGGRIRMGQLIEHLADRLDSGQLTDAQMSQIGEARHLARYKALFQQIQTFRRLRAEQRRITSEVTDAGTQLWRESGAGRWEGAIASLDRALISLRSSGAVSGAVRVIESLAGALSSIPPGTAETIGQIGVGMVAIGAAGAVTAGVAALFRTIASSAAGIGVAATAFASMGASAKWLLGGAGIALALADWQGIWASVTAVGPDGQSALGAVGAAFGGLGTEIKSAVTEIGQLTTEITKLIGLEVEGSVFVMGLRGIAGTIKAIADGIRVVREDARTLLGGGSVSDTTLGQTASGLGGALDDVSGNIWSQLGRRMSDDFFGRPRSDAAPTGGDPTFGLGPGGSLLGGGRVDVQGQANVDLNNHVTIDLTPAAQVLFQAAQAAVNQARVQVPLNTGQGMPDAGGGGRAVPLAPPNRM